MRALFLGLVIVVLGVSGAVAQTPCGGSFDAFVADLKKEARSHGHSRREVDGFFQGVEQDERTLRADRAQGIFTKPFLDFAKAVISGYRMDLGKKNNAKYDAVFNQAMRDYGVSRGVLLAFWALETDFGGFQGDFNTRNSLVTLSHDCRRPELFRPQVFAAIELYARGDFDPKNTTGAWAGEIGMVQMLPEDIIEFGVDGDGDGTVALKTSPHDALLSGAKMLQSLGWRHGEPWLQEVVLPNRFDVSQTGIATKLSVRDWARKGVKARNGKLGNASLESSILLPQGKGGPAFIAYPNFDVFFEWNQSFTYVTTAAYFATRLEGAPIMEAGTPQPGLDQPQMKELQRKLSARGYDVGEVDGILGAGTRAAVRAEQARLGLPADAWPTPDLLGRL